MFFKKVQVTSPPLIGSFPPSSQLSISLFLCFFFSLLHSSSTLYTLGTSLCISLLFLLVFRHLGGSLSSAEAPAGCLNKNSNNGKIESARGTMGRGNRVEPLFSLSSSHRAPRAFFFSPASLRHREQRREWVDKNWCGVAAKPPGTSQKWRVNELIC